MDDLRNGEKKGRVTTRQFPSRIERFKGPKRFSQRDSEPIFILSFFPKKQ